MTGPNQETIPDSPKTGQGDESAVARAMESYLARLERGEAPGVEEFVARHPAIADRLRTCLTTLQFVEQVSVPITSQESGGENPAHGLSLGDYQILKEIGRGGMGMLAPPQGGREG